MMFNSDFSIIHKFHQCQYVIIQNIFQDNNRMFAWCCLDEGGIKKVICFSAVFFF